MTLLFWLAVSCLALVIALGLYLLRAISTRGLSLFASALDRVLTPEPTQTGAEVHCDREVKDDCIIDKLRRNGL